MTYEEYKKYIFKNRTDVKAEYDKLGEPISLEQLREMANKPYWHIGLREESRPPYWEILNPLIARNPEDYGYGTDWVAYYYPPKNINMSKLWQCDFCSGRYESMTGERTSKNGNTITVETIVADYCPKCGEPVSKKAIAEKIFKKWLEWENK